MTTAEAIAALRREMRLTQLEFAERLGVTITSVSRYENRREPNPRVLEMLAELAESVKLGYLQNFFEAKRLGNIINSVKKLPSPRTGRRVLLEDLESFSDYLRISVAETCRMLVQQWEDTISPKLSHLLKEQPDPEQRRELFQLLEGFVGDVRGVAGVAEYVESKIQVYVSGSTPLKNPLTEEQKARLKKKTEGKQ